MSNKHTLAVLENCLLRPNWVRVPFQNILDPFDRFPISMVNIRYVNEKNCYTIFEHFLRNLL